MQRLAELTEQIETSNRIRPLVRGIIAQARTSETGEGPEALARRLWPNDRSVLALLTRASVEPTGSSATTLGTTTVADVVASIGPRAAVGELFRRTTALSFGRAASVFVPTVIASAVGNFIAPAAPIPIKALVLDGATLSAKKCAVAVALTREVVEGSNAESIVRVVLSESVGATLDALMLDATAGDDIRPAGLRWNVAATASGGGTTSEDMRADLATLAGLVAPVAGSQIAFIADAATAAKIKLSMPLLPFPVLPSSGLAAGMAMAIALPAIAVAGDAVPRIDVSTEAVYHSDDAAPLAIATPGSPNTVAAPARSLWQTDAIGLRLIMEISWGLRVAPSSAVAWMTGVAW